MYCEANPPQPKHDGSISVIRYVACSVPRLYVASGVVFSSGRYLIRRPASMLNESVDPFRKCIRGTPTWAHAVPRTPSIDPSSPRRRPVLCGKLGVETTSHAF